MTDSNEIALIFPGQGAQYSGMGKELYEGSDSARAIFDQAEARVSGLLKVMFEGSTQELTATRYCQPAIFTHSVAALKAFEATEAFQKYQPVYTCGHSLGEYAALVACGVLEFASALELVQKRAQCMEEAASLSKGAMAAVIGFEADALEKICVAHGVELANYNAPDQIVITGESSRLEAAVEALKAAGAKRVIPLAVSGAFHSALMRPAAERFACEVGKLHFSDPRFPILSNVDARPTQDLSRIRENLPRQMTSSVLWVKSIETIAAAGVTRFVEIGPGKVLKGLLRKINRELVVANIETAVDVTSFSEF